ncbi:homeobox protein DBX2-like [Polypterus senegalus]
MIPGIFPSQSPYWEMAGTSSYLQRPKPPGFGNSGKSFLIDNLLRNCDFQGPLSSWVPTTPLTVKMDPTAEQISPSGGPYSTRWLFQLVNPSDRQHAHSPNTEIMPQLQTGLAKHFFCKTPDFFLTYCGGSCLPPAPPAAFPKWGNSSIALWSQDINTKSRRGILRRAVFTEDQRKQLEKTFEKQKYISKTDRNKLATHLGLKESQVKIWFQNRRMKWRNSKEKEIFGHKSCEDESLLESYIPTNELIECASVSDKQEERFKQTSTHNNLGDKRASEQRLKKTPSMKLGKCDGMVLNSLIQHQNIPTEII